MSNIKALRDILESGTCHFGPGAFDGLSARIADAAGFSFVHASGGAIARSIGYPDVGLITMTEMQVRLAEIAEAVNRPVIADADTGYGNAHNAARCARAYQAAGAVALHIEDQDFPKKCGHYADISLIPTEEMAAKVAAMKDAVGDGMLVIARTDAVMTEGLEPALERMHRYLEAGADVAFVEGISDLATLRRINDLPAPKLINLAGASREKLATPEELSACGVVLALYPGEFQRAAIFAMEEVARTLLRTGSSRSVADRLATPARRDALVATRRYLS